jgi:hypothetical protein
MTSDCGSERRSEDISACIELDFSGELFPIVVNVQFVTGFTLKGVAAFGDVSDKLARTRIPFDPNVG